MAAAAAIVAATATAAGTGISVYGQMQQAKTAQRISEFNARQQEMEAVNADAEARENLKRQRRENERLLASQRARASASGVVTNTGSPLANLAENAALLEMNALDEQRAAKMRVRGLNLQAGLTRAEGKAQARAAKINAVGTLLSGGGQTAGMVSRSKHQGIY